MGSVWNRHIFGIVGINGLSCTSRGDQPNTSYLA